MEQLEYTAYDKGIAAAAREIHTWAEIALSDPNAHETGIIMRLLAQKLDLVAKHVIEL